MQQRAFPPYMGKGSNGPDVLLVQVAIKTAAARHSACQGLIPDGDFGEQTELAVKWLQDDLGFTGDDVDGCFGPNTRRRFAAKYGTNFDAIPFGALQGLTIWFDGTENKGPWEGFMADDPRDRKVAA
jgi:peptidoglycan hydrolase-like protein with peptidoglycan-binding domain